MDIRVGTIVAGSLLTLVTSYQWEDLPIFNTAELDWMPYLGRPAGLVR